MISEEKFIQILDKIKEREKNIDEIQEVLKFDTFYELPVVSIGGWMQDQLIYTYVEDDFSETVFEYLYPLSSKEYNIENPLVVTVTKESGIVQYQITNKKELYNYLKENNGLRTSC